MDIRTIVTKGSAVGVVRLVLLTLAAAGFLAMHGIAATDPVAGHLSPMDAPLTASHGAPAVAHAHDDRAAATTASAPLPGHGSHEHDDMAACLFVLLTVIAGVMMYALGIPVRRTTPVAQASDRQGRGPPRPPPRPVFLTLCVFRL
ncbi:hypothetical protein [Pseudonocardia kunmingensis]|uniref:Uncharacterized protein n=1 Tax=Pseudonocardia kunmingensis TaxID=630975 RepID=A0A543DL20_9PSEU|nr:hypothetical protein [Pseudonocardia kunmingensis]TQM09945.1 hypothetical protein FB558_5723 [Pseudonocardia kunmingensis]